MHHFTDKRETYNPFVNFLKNVITPAQVHIKNKPFFWLRQKKVVLFPEIGRVKFFCHLPARMVGCVSEYIFIFCFKKHTNKKQNKVKKNREKSGKSSVIQYRLRICFVHF